MFTCTLVVLPCCGLVALEDAGQGAKPTRPGGVTTPGAPGIVCILCKGQLCKCVDNKCVNCGGSLTQAVPRFNKLIEERFADKKLAKRLTAAILRYAGTIKDGKVDEPAHDRAIQQLLALEKQMSPTDRQRLRDIGDDVAATFKGTTRSK
jgi:hypothetical protein